MKELVNLIDNLIIMKEEEKLNVLPWSCFQLLHEIHFITETEKYLGTLN